MKVFISQPMKGKTEEQIRAERAEAEAFIRNTFTGVEIIESITPDEALRESSPLACLARSIGMLATADLLVLLPSWQSARGCKIEFECGTNYGLKVFCYEPAQKQRFMDLSPLEPLPADFAKVWDNNVDKLYES